MQEEIISSIEFHKALQEVKNYHKPMTDIKKQDRNKVK